MLSLSWLGTDPLSAPSASLHSYPHTLVCAIHGIPRVSPGEDKVCSGKNMGLTLACAPLQCPFKSTGSCAAAPTCSSTSPCFVGLCMTSTGEVSSFKDHLFSQGESWNSWSERTFQPNKVFPKQAGEQWIHIWHLRCLSFAKAALRQKSPMKSTILQDCSNFPEKPVSVLLWIRGLLVFPSLRGAQLKAGLAPFHCWITAKKNAGL